MYVHLYAHVASMHVCLRMYGRTATQYCVSALWCQNLFTHECEADAMKQSRECVESYDHQWHDHLWPGEHSIMFSMYCI